MVFHLVRDLCRRSWFHILWVEQVRASLFQHYASYRHSGLVYLPPWLFLRISDGQCRGQHSEFGVQPCRFCEQDRILPCHLGLCQEEHLGKQGRPGCSTPSIMNSSSNCTIVENIVPLPYSTFQQQTLL